MSQVIVNLTTGEVTENHNFVLPPKTLEEVKVDKVAQVSAKFNELMNAPVTVGTVTYNGGKGSVEAIKNYIDYGIKKGLTTFNLWGVDNNPLPYTLDEANTILLAISDQVVAAEFYLRTKKNEIEACSTVEAVELVEV